MKDKLRVVPNRAVVIGDLGPLDPGGGADVSSTCDQRFRVTGARVAAAVPQSRIERLVRRLPGLGRIVTRLLHNRDVANSTWATAQVKIDRVTVGDDARPLDQIDDLPIAPVGAAISVSVTNRSDRPLVARVLVEGVKL